MKGSIGLSSFSSCRCLNSDILGTLGHALGTLGLALGTLGLALGTYGSKIGTACIAFFDSVDNFKTFFMKGTIEISSVICECVSTAYIDSHFPEIDKYV